MLSVAQENVCMTIQMSDKRLVRSNDCFVGSCYAIDTATVTRQIQWNAYLDNALVLALFSRPA